MNTTSIIGLGEPETSGKKALFRPPVEQPIAPQPAAPAKSSKPTGERKRIRTTLDLSSRALTILQELQHRHRLKTGKVLPLWQAVSRAVEFYGEAKGVHER
jgi:hypothetical protein